jgi:hypothetical protein
MFTLIKLALRFALSWVGVVLIALVGVGLEVYGLVAVTKEEEKEPTAVAVESLDGGKPGKEWVQVTGGVVYWPEAMTLTVTKKERFTGNKSEKEEAEYIPLVTPEVRDEWLEATARDGEQAKLDYSKCKVLLVVYAKDTPAGFPSKPGKVKTFGPAKTPTYEQLFPEHDPTGRVIPPLFVDSTARRDLARLSPGMDLDKMTIVEVGGRPPTHQDMGVTILIGVFLLVPLALKAVLGAKFSNWLYPPADYDDGWRPAV